MKIEWVDGSEIRVRIENEEIVISANKEGLLSLAKQLTALAEETPGSHVHSVLHKTDNFNLPVRRLRSGQYKGRYKVPSGSLIYTCFSSDFFHPDADGWRNDAWKMMQERSDCTFFMITKEPMLVSVIING